MLRLLGRLALVVVLVASLAPTALQAGDSAAVAMPDADYYTALVLPTHDPFEILPQYWRVDDGRTVSVMWDFTSPTPLLPVVEVPKAGAYWWYEGSKSTLTGDARLSPDGVVLGETDDDEPQDPDVIGILKVEDTNPEEDQPKHVTLVYCWHRQGGGVAPPGPTVTINPPNANITGIQRQIVGNCEQVTITMTFPAPCPPAVSASFSRAPGGPAVVVRSAAINGVCGPITPNETGDNLSLESLHLP